MPRSSIKKTDDIEKKEKTTTPKKASKSKATVAKKSSPKISTDLKEPSTKKVSATKNTGAKKSTTTKDTVVKKTTSKKNTSTTVKKIVTKKATAKKEKPTTKTSVKKGSASKSKASKKESTTKKTSTKKVAVTKKTTTPKDTVVKKTTSKKSTTATVKKPISKKPTVKKSVAKKSTTKKAVAKKSTTKKVKPTKNYLDTIEYYDLPYRYNQTIVKVLAQNPNTLFVYWDVADYDIENYKKQFGDNFLYITKPVLVVYNITNNYSFEIDINDFANNWYIHVNDTKCKYVVELGRRPIENNISQNTENNEFKFIKIFSSNNIEIPNDHVLFYKENQKIHFKNVKTNNITEKTINKKYGKHLAEIYKYYSLENAISGNKFDFANPSSNSPTSNVM